MLSLRRVRLGLNRSSESPAASKGFEKKQILRLTSVVFSVERIRGVWKAVELWEEIKTPTQATAHRNI